MRTQPTPPRRTLVPSILLSALFALGFGGGCAGPHPAPQSPHIPGYESLQEDFQHVDLTPMRHRRIVLDPGHGGFFRGAVGPNGLTEAEVNLGVALYLRGLLEWAGAEVWLTRSADTDFLSPADSSLATDLAMRVSLSDSLQPDVFLSIHHNSNAALDRTINETQTYYPLSDDGASLDLARAIHRHLVINLGIQPASIRPGNFHVLRNATVPAVLGEPAMISHPVMAGRLSLAASQRLEAEAYFLGLLDYFSGGLPVWSGATVDTVTWGGPADPTTVTWQFLPAGNTDSLRTIRSSDLPGPDPALTRLSLDGRSVAAQLSPDARTVTWELPPDLSPTPHTLELRGRNLAGRATPPRRTVLLPRAGTNLKVTVTLASDSGLGGVHWSSLNGGPLPTGTLDFGSGLVFPVAPDEPAWTLVKNLENVWPGREAHFTATGHERRICQTTIVNLPKGQFLRLVTRNDQPFAPPAGWRPRLGVHGNTPLVTLDANGPYWLEGAGVLPLLDVVPDDPAQPRTVTAAATTWETTALLPGLQGKVILLDPAGGDTETDGAGPLGLRGADLNLAVAEQAALLLRGAGAVVHLTRHDETALPPVEKVRLAGRLGADLFLTIGRHAPGAPRVVRHHPGSATGSLWAAAAVRATSLLPAAEGGPAGTCGTEESTAYLLRHTACPALEWRLDPPAGVAAEMRQVLPGWHRAEARAILLATAAISGQPAVFDHVLQPDVLLRQLESQGGLAAAKVDWVLVDGNLPWSPLPPGLTVTTRSHTLNPPSGPGLPGLLSRHLMEIHAANRWQLWLVTREQEQWHATLLLGDIRTNR